MHDEVYSACCCVSITPRKSPFSVAEPANELSGLSP
nr:MAG TPA: hypothetical protein [Caudoviricetes sp.]